MFGFKARREAAIMKACSEGRHERAGLVTHDGSKLTAPCFHCGATLTRTASGWRTASTASLPTL